MVYSSIAEVRRGRDILVGIRAEGRRESSPGFLSYSYVDASTELYKAAGYEVGL